MISAPLLSKQDASGKRSVLTRPDNTYDMPLNI